MSWEFNSTRQMYQALVGHYYGPEPEKKRQEIIEDRKEIAERISYQLGLKTNMRGMELGSGCGFSIPTIAPKVEKLFACDVSASFLDEAKANNKTSENVDYLQVENGNYSRLADDSLDFAYAHAVFIHFDLYDLALNFQELARVMKPGALLNFDFLQVDSKDFLQSPIFNEHLDLYKKSEITSDKYVHYHSKKTVFALLNQYGFHIVNQWSGDNCNVEVVAIRADSRWWWLKERVNHFVRINLERIKRARGHMSWGFWRRYNYLKKKILNDQ